MKTNNFKIIIFAILLSGIISSPITRDTLRENHSMPGKQIHRRSAYYDKCINNVTSQCKRLQKYSPSAKRLDFYEECLVDGFDRYCR